MFQGGRDVHPTELPRGFRERFDKEAANVGRVTLSLSDSWTDMDIMGSVETSSSSPKGGDVRNSPAFRKSG